MGQGYGGCECAGIRGCSLFPDARTRTAEEMCFVWRTVSAVEGILCSKDWLNSEGFVQSLPLQITAGTVIAPHP